jgi:NodT family efflux transporter outer membrane factor (OMF) lipoprotein
MLGACANLPPAPQPALPMPAAWAIESPWREGQPRDGAPKGPWWQHYGDPLLDQLQRQAREGSPTLAAAGARLQQARALAASASAGLFPSLSLGSRAARQRISANRPLSSYSSSNFSTVQNDFSAAFTVNYEVDLSGRIEQAVAGAEAAAEQTAADLENTRLVLAADLAANYVNLRAADTELGVLLRAIELQRRALAFVASRRELGAASGLEVAQQQALLDNTLTQVDLLRRQRSQFEHAIATLVGTPAPLFAIAPEERRLSLPEVPLGLPSDLLERRPDVAAAERAMAVANAQIGLAQAAFYPSVTLAPTVGVESRVLASLFEAPSLLWSFGVSAAQVLFDGGRLKANLEFARAGHEAAAANYRRVVLGAMQEVEDGISGLAALSRAAAQAGSAVASAGRVHELASGRYEGGASSYLEVITAQQALLASERQAAQVHAQSLLASVFLVKALGGDW